MKWPPGSPDYNPSLGGPLLASNPLLKSYMGLALLCMINGHYHVLMPMQFIDNTINSMREHCQACIAVRGDQTYY
ncbi:hypothetical protein CEXT_554951 [Caerostris extrusa]|uniref:Uncharacterized protein n=1 Tax=Caerostris extrusa TaxID=172846 RepID=A0AAV4N8I0_CAEEX|nr:hypothetical protein CEXT_554951 [Caerostris extrusa]